VALDVAAVAVRGHWVKHTYPGSPPLPERDPPPDNRWQRGDIIDALYLANSEATAWAEWYRHLAERMVPPLAQMPRELWTWGVIAARPRQASARAQDGRSLSVPK
jgi:RES domain